MTRTMCWLMIGTLVLAVTPGVVSAGQEETDHPKAKTPKALSDRERALREGHLEVPDDPYVPSAGKHRATSPGGRYVRDDFVSIQVNVNALGQNIIGDAGNEPSIAVDPTNPNRIAIGWREFADVTNNFRQAGWGYTNDGGATWHFPGVIEPGVFRSDPVLDFNAQGDFFYNSLTATTDLSEFWCNVYKSTDGGASWDTGVYAFGGDKQWMTTDRSGGIGHDNMYAYWTKWFTCTGCLGHFTRSYDAGATFLETTDVPGNPQWGTLAVGPDGELYVAGDGFTVAKSTTMQNIALPAQWDFSRTVNLDGSMSSSGGPNPGGLLGQVWVAVDHSDGPTRGNVYLLCSVQRSSTSDPLDVMFSRSTNGGNSWSPPVRVNDDASESNYQWFGTMSVAPTGRIDVIWNDTRNDPGGYDSELYYSYSEDAGASWSPNVAMTPSYDPHIGWPDQNKMGDYYDMVSDELGADLAYAATFNGEQDVYHLRIGPRCRDAGAITLDRAKYLCASEVGIALMDCGLNQSDLFTEQVAVDVDSDTEMGVETVTLFETSPSSARFEGSINIDTIDAADVLQVAEGDTITATYIDADDGEGGVNVQVIATATVDCSPPSISDVATTNVEAFAATVTFNTDEPTTGTVRYGTSCLLLSESAAHGGYETAHTVLLTDLTDNTIYFYAIDVEDEAGNPTTDDNGGACYTFDTTDVPAYYTEQFTSSFDLDFTTLTFIPNGSSDYYFACAESIGELPTDPAGGIEPPSFTPSEEDGYASVMLPLGDTVSLFGVAYNIIYMGSNGYVTFASGDSEWDESLSEHFSMARVSALYDDFSPQDGDGVSYRLFDDRIAITWLDVPEYNTTNSNTFQTELFFDGTITISYAGVASDDSVVGLSRGGGIPQEFAEVDLSSLGDCMIDCNLNGIPDDEDLAMGTSLDCNGNAIPDECDTDCQPNGTPDDCDITAGTSGDCNANSIPDECDVAGGTSPDVNEDGVPDECQVVPPLPEDSLGVTCTLDEQCLDEARCIAGMCYAPKHRYISVARHPNQVPQTARRVTLLGGGAGPWWIGAPYAGAGGLTLAELTDTPIYADLDFVGNWPDVVHVMGCEVVTGQVYLVQSIESTSDIGDEGQYSAPIELHTPSVWGDVVSTCFDNDCLPPDAIVGIDDILAAITRFQGIDNAPLTWLDIDPSLGSDLPNQQVNIGDILGALEGFQGREYPGDGPAGCAP